MNNNIFKYLLVKFNSKKESRFLTILKRLFSPNGYIHHHCFYFNQCEYMIVLINDVNSRLVPGSIGKDNFNNAFKELVGRFPEEKCSMTIWNDIYRYYAFVKSESKLYLAHKIMMGCGIINISVVPNEHHPDCKSMFGFSIVASNGVNMRDIRDEIKNHLPKNDIIFDFEGMFERKISLEVMNMIRNRIPTNLFPLSEIFATKFKNCKRNRFISSNDDDNIDDNDNETSSFTKKRLFRASDVTNEKIISLLDSHSNQKYADADERFQLRQQPQKEQQNEILLEQQKTPPAFVSQLHYDCFTQPPLSSCAANQKTVDDNIANTMEIPVSPPPIFSITTEQANALLDNAKKCDGSSIFKPFELKYQDRFQNPFIILKNALGFGKQNE